MKKQISIVLAMVMLLSLAVSVNVFALPEDAHVYTLEDFSSYAGAETWDGQGNGDRGKTLTAYVSHSSITRSAEGGIGGKAADNKALKFTSTAHSETKQAMFGKYDGQEIQDQARFVVEYQVYDASTGSFSVRRHLSGTPTAEVGSWKYENIPLTKNTWHTIGIHFRATRTIDFFVDGVYKTSVAYDSASGQNTFAGWPYLVYDFAANAEGFIAVDNYTSYYTTTNAYAPEAGDWVPGQEEDEEDEEDEEEVTETTYPADATFYVSESFSNYDGVSAITAEAGSDGHKTLTMYITPETGIDRSGEGGIGGKDAADKALVFTSSQAYNGKKEAILFKSGKSWDNKNAIIEVDVYAEAAGNFSFRANSDGTGITYADGNWKFENVKLKKNKWHHIAIHFDANASVKLYVDGILTDISTPNPSYMLFPAIIYTFDENATGIAAIDNYAVYYTPANVYEGIVEYVSPYLVEERFDTALTGGARAVSLGTWLTMDEPIVTTLGGDSAGSAGVWRNDLKGIGGRSNVDGCLGWITDGTTPASADATVHFGQYLTRNQSLRWTSVYGEGTDKPTITVEWEFYNDTQNGTIDIGGNRGYDSEGTWVRDWTVFNDDSPWAFLNLPITKNAWNEVAVEFNVGVNGLSTAKLYINRKFVDIKMSQQPFYAHFPHAHFNWKAGDLGTMAVDNFKFYYGEYENKGNELPESFEAISFDSAEGEYDDQMYVFKNAIIWPAKISAESNLKCSFAVYAGNDRLESVKYMTLDGTKDNPYILPVKYLKENEASRTAKLFIWDKDFAQKIDVTSAE